MTAALRTWDAELRELDSRLAKRVEPPSSDHAALRLDLAGRYLERGRFDDALREIDAALREIDAALPEIDIVLRADSQRADLHLLRALTLEASGDPAGAADAFRSSWALDSGDPVKAYHALARVPALAADARERARVGLADAYRARLAGATSATRFPVLAGIPETLERTLIVGDATTARAFALFAARKYDEAVAALKAEAVGRADNPAESPLERLARARRYEESGRIPEARREYESVLGGTLGGRSILYVGIGRLAQVDGDFDAAIAAFERAARLAPNDSNVHKELAGAYAAQSRIDEAERELMAAILIQPRDAQAYAALGQLYLDAARDTDAVPALERALALMPDGYEVRYALATAFDRIGRPDEAAQQRELFARAQREASERTRRQMGSEAEQQDAPRGTPSRDGR